MSLFFNKVQRRKDPRDLSGEKLWYPILKSIGKIGEKEVAREISDETTLNPKEAEMALHQFQKVLIKALLDGKTVQLGELGSFQLRIKSKGTSNESDVRVSQIKKVSVRFMPSQLLRSSLDKVHFTSIEEISLRE